MSHKLPYVYSTTVIGKVLEKIKAAATPARFTQDFLSAKLGLKGGTPKSIIPFLKRAGFLGSDGVPTDRYRQFRNPNLSGQAAAAALQEAYRPLYEMNEYVHDLSDKELEGLVVQATGAEPKSSTVRSIVASFKALRGFALFDGEPEEDMEEEAEEAAEEDVDLPPHRTSEAGMRLGLSYTINLNLPATSDIAVFDAIFKSLRQHLLRPR